MRSEKLRPFCIEGFASFATSLSEFSKQSIREIRHADATKIRITRHRGGRSAVRSPPTSAKVPSTKPGQAHLKRFRIAGADPERSLLVRQPCYQRRLFSPRVSGSGQPDLCRCRFLFDSDMLQQIAFRARREWPLSPIAAVAMPQPHSRLSAPHVGLGLVDMVGPYRPVAPPSAGRQTGQSSEPQREAGQPTTAGRARRGVRLGAGTRERRRPSRLSRRSRGCQL